MCQYVTAFNKHMSGCLKNCIPYVLFELNMKKVLFSIIHSLQHFKQEYFILNSVTKTLDTNQIRHTFRDDTRLTKNNNFIIMLIIILGRRIQIGGTL